MAWVDGSYPLKSGQLKIDARVEAQGPDPVVSCDMFWIDTSTQFFGSFRTPPLSNPPVEITINATQLVARLLHTQNSSPATLTLQQQPDGSIVGSFFWLRPDTDPYDSGPMECAAPKPDVYREVNWEVDFDVSVGDRMASDEMDSKEASSIGVSGRTVSTRQCLLEAGIRMNSNGINPARVLARPDLGWTQTLIHNLITTQNSTNTSRSNPNAMSWEMYVIHATTLVDSPATLGLMPDLSRRGAAIFVDQIRARGGSEQALALLHTFTTVHEIGHTFNLPHAFESINGVTHADVATFMNYPHKYTGAARAIPPAAGAFPENFQQFFSDFDFQFSQGELFALRHGGFESTVMGGSQYIGEFSDFRDDGRPSGAPGGKQKPANWPGNRVQTGGRPGSCLKLDLRIRPDRSLFEFGEPVHLELKLSAPKGDVETVFVDPDPASHQVYFQISRPGRPVSTFEPFMHSLVYPTPKEISEDKPLYADIDLTVGANGFTFLEPGFYTIRASTTISGTLLMSPPVRLFVCYPDKPTERAVVPALTDEVATYLALRGGPHLTEALKQLQDLAALLPNHPLAAYFRLYQAHAKAFGTQRVAGEGRKIEVSQQPKNDPAEMKKVLGIATRATSSATPFSNMMFEKYGRQFADQLGQEDAKASLTLRRAVAGKLMSEGRGVSPERLKTMSPAYDTPAPAAKPKAAAKSKAAAKGKPTTKSKPASTPRSPRPKK